MNRETAQKAPAPQNRPRSQKRTADGDRDEGNVGAPTFKVTLEGNYLLNTRTAWYL
jgi:hypothetical protein